MFNVKMIASKASVLGRRILVGRRLTEFLSQCRDEGFVSVLSFVIEATL